MFGSQKPLFSLAALAVSHGVLLLAGFFAPYDFASQNRETPFAPPTRIHFTDERGGFHIRPFVYRLRPRAGIGEPYEEARGDAYPVFFFVSGAPYRLLGIFRSRRHLFGTNAPATIFLIGSDGYGRDQFSRLLYGGQISLFAGLLATAISVSLGLMLGGIAGFYGRWPDDLIMRASEIFLALPWLYLLFAVRAFLPLHIPPNQIFILLIAVLGAVGWARPARLIRGIVLSAREREYVLAARGFGASDLYLLRRHVLPQAVRRCAHANGSFDSSVCSRGNGAFVLWPRGERTGAQLGKSAGQSAAISSAGVVLVDVFARYRTDPNIPRILQHWMVLYVLFSSWYSGWWAPDPTE